MNRLPAPVLLRRYGQRRPAGGREHDRSQDVDGLGDRVPGVEIDLVVATVLAPPVTEVVAEAVTEEELPWARSPVAFAERDRKRHGVAARHPQAANGYWRCIVPGAGDATGGELKVDEVRWSVSARVWILAAPAHAHEQRGQLRALARRGWYYINVGAVNSSRGDPSRAGDAQWWRLAQEAEPARRRRHRDAVDHGGRLRFLARWLRRTC